MNNIGIYLPTDILELIQHEIQIKNLNEVEHFELIVNRLNVIIKYISSFGIKEFDQQTIELDKKTNGALNLASWN